jgi:hypothetical protein
MKHVAPLLTLVAAGSLLLQAGTASAQDAKSTHDAPAALIGPAPELDLDTLTATIAARTLEAERYWGATFVGAVDPELYVAVALVDAADVERPRRVVVYLCDGEEVGEYLIGDLRADTTTLEHDRWSVEMSITDDVAWGTIIRDDDPPRLFTAGEIRGDAGLYSTRFTFEGEEYMTSWIVLPDGSQRGRTLDAILDTITETVKSGESVALD